MDPDSMERKQKHVAEEYLSSLSDLQCNSKPLINMLTMLAEENIDHAPIIVKVVEQHITKVPTELKLPILYLIDSIVKNVKSSYVALFGQCIVNIFCHVFEKVSEKVRERMYALRQTWNEVFPTSKLYNLDVRVKQIDKNWPITAVKKQPTEIHVNPIFLKAVPNSAMTSDIEEVLQAKTRELLELRKRKLELELEATKKHLEEQQKQLAKVNDPNAVLDPSVLDTLNDTPGTSAQMQPIMPAPKVPAIMPTASVPPAGGVYAQNYARTSLRMPMSAQQPNMPIGTHVNPACPVNINKVKVNPVNPALVNSLRHRDPRLMRQQMQQLQQQQQMPDLRTTGNDGGQHGHQKRMFTSDNAMTDDKRENYKSSKSSRNNNNVADNNKSPTRHTSTARSSSHRNGKSSSSSNSSSSSSNSRDKERDRKRGNSGDAKNYSSSGSDRRLAKAGSREHSNKSDKDSGGDVTASPTSRHTKSSPNTSPNKSKDMYKRGSSRDNKPSNAGKHHEQTTPENMVTSTKDIDLRALTITADTTDPRAGTTSTVMEIQKKATAALKGLEQNIKRDCDTEPSLLTPASTSSTQKTTKVEDVDLRQFLSGVLLPTTATSGVTSNAHQATPSSNIVLQNAVSVSGVLGNTTQNMFTNLTASSSSTKSVSVSISKSPTTQPPKVSFKIQKIFNKLAKSTETLSTVTSTSASSSASSTKNLTTATAAEIHEHLRNTKQSIPEVMEIDDSDNDNDIDDDDGDYHDNNDKDNNGKKLNTRNTITIDGKKRLSEPGSVTSDEPMAKKSKSAKMDALFGTEDVDLRTLTSKIASSSGGKKDLTPPPPPNISSSEEDQQQQHETNKKRENHKILKSSGTNQGGASTQKLPSNFEDVRAKFAKATRNEKLSKSERAIERARSKLMEINANEDENTQEVNDEKIRIILSQAQEMLELKSLNKEQYKHLIQTVMTMNENNKLKEAKRRESLQNLQNSMKAAKDNTTEPPNDDSDSAVDFEVDVELMAARDAVHRKRIPKIPKNASATANADDNLLTTKSPIADSDAARVDTVANANRLKPKEKRNRPSKWSERTGSSTGSGNGESQRDGNTSQRPWGSNAQTSKRGNNRTSAAQQPAIMLGQQNQLRPSMQGGNWGKPQNMPMPMPFVNPSMQHIRSSVPPPPQPPMALPPVLPTLTPNGLPKPCNSIDNPQAELVRTITIDGQSKDIRIYDDVAIVFMESDQPREIGFQPGQRAIIIDNQEPVTLRFNDEFKPIMVAGELHRVRFGFPSRELYIDEHWYEIYFGGPPVSIPIKNGIHVLKAEGPPPQVNIGPLRKDLVLGRIHMIVEAVNLFPLFLDARVQTFRFENIEHTVQFADNLQTVVLDGQPQQVEYGGLPKGYMLNGRRYFIRFTTLPKGVIAGKVNIKDMIYVKMDAPPLKQAVDIPPVIEQPTKSDPLIETEIQQSRPTVDDTNIDATNTNTTTTTNSTTANLLPATVLGKMNIDELFQKLVSTGILNNHVANIGLPTETVKPVKTGDTDNKEDKKPGGAGGDTVIDNKTEDSQSQSMTIEEQLPPIVPIDLGNSDSIKTRQEAIVATLYSGMQCSSCGVRFPPEQTIKYSQHLDWHFRQNRRERDSTRKAHSRKWYYELNDWLQYEEIEDLEEREKNFFEIQQNELDIMDDMSNQRSSHSPVPTCPADPDDVDRTCDVCHEKFEQFYNEELEEWHLRLAIRMEDKIYHPLCYEDYKASLIPSAKTVDSAHVKADDEDILMQEDDNAVDVVIKIEDESINEAASKSTVNAHDAFDDDDDDDVIVLPNEEPSVTEIEDDEEEYIPVNVTAEDMKAGIEEENKNNESAMESDVEIQEPHIPFTDLDTYVEKELPTLDENSQASFMNVKIKEEPKDDEDDDGFEDVGTVIYGPHDEISIQSSEETQTQTIVSSVNSPATISDERSPSSNMFSSAVTDTTSTAAIASSAATATNDAETPATTILSEDSNNITLDGNMEPADGHNLSIAGPPPAIPLGSLVNRIKINITKNTTTAAQATATATATETTTTSTISSNTNNLNSNTETTNINMNNLNTNISTIPVLCGGGTAPSSSVHSNSNVSNISVIGSYGNYRRAEQPPKSSVISSIASAVTRQRTPTPPAPPIEDTITYDLKPALQKATLKKMKKIESGVETSGLCSIM